MPTFEAMMRVTYNETWTVEAKNESEAKLAFEALDEDVQTDDAGGECVDWEIFGRLKKVD
jgi:hypothetical protein